MIVPILFEGGFMLVVISIIQNNEYDDKKYCILDTVTGSESVLDYDAIYGIVKSGKDILGVSFYKDSLVIEEYNTESVLATFCLLYPDFKFGVLNCLK